MPATIALCKAIQGTVADSGGGGGGGGGLGGQNPPQLLIAIADWILQLHFFARKLKPAGLDPGKGAGGRGGEPRKSI